MNTNRKIDLKYLSSVILTQVLMVVVVGVSIYIKRSYLGSIIPSIALVILVASAGIILSIMDYLRSVRTTVVLLILIVGASIVGTIIPQNWTVEQYTVKYGDMLSRALIGLEVTNLYHSAWYMALLVVFCINLYVCSMWSFGPLVKALKRPSSEAARVDLRSLPSYRKFRVGSDTDDTVLRVRELLARSLYRLKYTDPDSGIYYFERGKIGRLGSVITHASIVIILIGGIFVGLLGFKEYVRIPVGETVDVPRSDFQVRADDFKAEFYPDSGIAREYTSKLTIIEGGVPKLTDTVEVNHPMKYKGIKFYQSSYGVSDTVEVELSEKGKSETDGEVLGNFRVNVGELFEVPDSQLKIKAVVVIPDFIMDSSGRVGTRSAEPRNPAALFELYEGDELKDRTWSFLRFPLFHASEKTGYSFKLMSLGYYTQLQVSRDPGLVVVWIGSGLIMVGMFLSFYLHHKRVWIRLSEEDGGTVMEMGGRSYKDRAGFEREFGRLESFFGQPGADIDSEK